MMPSSLVATQFGNQAGFAGKQQSSGSPPQGDAAQPQAHAVKDVFSNPSNILGSSNQRKGNFRLFQATSNEEGKDMIEPSFPVRSS